MKTLRTIFGFGRTGRAARVGSRFDRYYAGVVQPGVGFPTADEARRDLIRYDQTTQQYNWMR